MTDLRERNRLRKIMQQNIIIALIGLAIGLAFSGILWPTRLH